MGILGVGLFGVTPGAVVEWCVVLIGVWVLIAWVIGVFLLYWVLFHAAPLDCLLFSNLILSSRTNRWFFNYILLINKNHL